MSEYVICESCHYSYDPDEVGGKRICSICIRALRAVRFAYQANEDSIIRLLASSPASEKGSK